MLHFVCDVVKDTGKEEYLRPFIRIGLDFPFHLILCAKNERQGTTAYSKLDTDQ